MNVSRKIMYFIILVVSIIIAAIGLELRLSAWYGWILVAIGIGSCIFGAWNLARVINAEKKNDK